MNIKILTHIMPWDIDCALLVFDKLKQSSYFIDNEDKIYIDSFFADRTLASCETGYAEFVDIAGAWRSTRRDRLL
jgi:hypothetical protein